MQCEIHSLQLWVCCFWRALQATHAALHLKCMFTPVTGAVVNSLP